MKKFSASVIALLCMAGLAVAQPAATTTTSSTPNPNAPEITFKKDSHDFGTVKNGADISYEFEFTNTGKEPLIISDVQRQCGCTTPSYSKEPIAPGKTGKVKVSYDTKRTGSVTKNVTVISNAKTASKVLTFTINVLPAENAEPVAPVAPPATPAAPKN